MQGGYPPQPPQGAYPPQQPVPAPVMMTQVQVTAAPPAQAMQVGVVPPNQVMGFNGQGKDIARGMSNQHAFVIKEVIEPHGCCYSCCRCGFLPGCNSDARTYRIVGDSFIEQNDAICMCCGVTDWVSKVYFKDFGKACCGLGEGGFASEHGKARIQLSLFFLFLSFSLSLYLLYLC